jgi:hypothetical protein
MVAKRTFILLAPLLISPCIGFLVADGYVTFGAGEKDLLLLIPWCIWSFLFIVSGGVLWRKKLTFKRWLFKSLLYSLLTTLSLWLCLLVYSVVST